jgi:hypothetical protein
MQFSDKKSNLKDSNNKSDSELRSENKEIYVRSTSIWIAEREAGCKVSPSRRIANDCKVSAEIETDRDDPVEFKIQQQSIKEEPVNTLTELYEAAEIGKPIFQDTLTKILDQVCAAYGDQKDKVEVQFDPLKGRDRAQAKQMVIIRNEILVLVFHGCTIL